MIEYDVFVIGTGMAGITVAMKSAKKGLRVGVADSGSMAAPVP